MPMAPAANWRRATDTHVILEVGPQSRGALGEETRHPQEIPVGGRTIQQQGRCVESFDGQPDPWIMGR